MQVAYPINPAWPMTAKIVNPTQESKPISHELKGSAVKIIVGNG
jgi:hypothetical protein